VAAEQGEQSGGVDPSTLCTLPPHARKSRPGARAKSLFARLQKRAVLWAKQLKMFQSATESTEWILYKTLEAKFQYSGPLIVPVLHLSELLATAL